MIKYQEIDYNYRREGKRINKMAGAVDKPYKRSSKQIIFLIYKREIMKAMMSI